MVEVFDCPIMDKINNTAFRKKLINFCKNTSCCSSYPKCEHPRIQSHPKLDEEFFDIKNSINNLFENYLQRKDFKFLEKKVWAYYVPKNKNTNNLRHNHFLKMYSATQLSALMYLTPTILGTDFYSFKIKPKINKWHVWHSGLYHEPEKGVSSEDRLVIALSSAIL